MHGTITPNWYEPCIGVMDRSCVDVCPVSCIYEGDDQLYIHSDERIDCAACEFACPVTASFHEDDVPDQWRSYIGKNRGWTKEHV